MISRQMRVLVTSGGTREPIDGVRSIVNTSTGATGAAAVEAAARQGAQVVLLHGQGAVLPAVRGITLAGYTTFADLRQRLEALLAESPPFDVIIHAAAVSDFSPREIVTESGVKLEPGTVGKIPSEEGFSVSFSRNPKLIDLIAARTPASLLVGFKLTNTREVPERLEAVSNLAARRVCDVIVHNDLHDIGPEHHIAAIYDREGLLLKKTADKKELARTLMLLCRELVTRRYE